jgi:hypothetical protein
MAGIIWQIIREDDDGRETVVEEYNSKIVAQSRLAYFQSHGDCYYYLDSR